jgi:hypothetical protein
MAENQGRKLLGEQLVEAGVIDDEGLRLALTHQRKSGGRLGHCLVDLCLATEHQIVTALARKFECAVVDVASLPRTPAVESAMELLPAEVALRSHCLPIAADRGSLTVAMADPTNYDVVDELSFRVGRRVRVNIAGEREIDEAVRRLYALSPLERAGEPEPAPVSTVSTTASLAAAAPAPATAAAVGAGQGQVQVKVEAPGTPWTADEVVAALVRVMVRRGLVTEVELVAELERRR